MVIPEHSASAARFLCAREDKIVTHNQHDLPRADEQAHIKHKAKEERRIDAEVEDSFPASDPPSYAGGPHRAGAPHPQKSKPKPHH